MRGLLGHIIEVARREGGREMIRRGLQEALVLAGNGLLGLAARLTDVAHLALGREERRLLRRNAAFKSRHRGRRAFIIGNGPSLARQDLSRLAGEVTFAVNKFWAHPAVELWQPTYYCLHDPFFFDGSEASRQFFAGLRARVRDSTFLVPHYAHKLITGESLLPPERTYYVGIRGSLKDGLRSVPDLSRAVPAAMTMVSHLAVMAAMCMGCDPIYLIGLDHDWLAHRGVEQHFYEGETVPDHPDAEADRGLTPYIDELRTMLGAWSAYEALERCARRHGIRILNATDGGFLDVFRRARYASLFPA